MNKKGKFLAVLLLVVFALSMVVFGVACKKDKGNTGDTGSTGTQSESKTATYYTDTVDGEYVVELFGNDCLLKIGSETMLGKFTLNSGAITFTTDKGTFEGTITGDEIDFTYDGRQYLMLEKVERTVRFSDGTEQKVLNGKTAVKPAADPAAPDNKAFVGWYADESYSSLYNFGTPVRGDISVYARMVDNPVGGMVYTATAIYDDGSKKEIKTVGGKVYGLETLAEKDGKAFDGWYVSDFNSADKLTYKYNESIALNQNVNLYPVWKDGITGLSVTSEKVTWDSYATGAKYDIKVSSTVSAGTQQTVSQTEFKISDYLKVAGEYVVTVSTDGVSKTAYYINKALARPTVEIIDGTTVKYNAVANAEKYLVTVDCGNPDHRHTQFDNGTSTVYDISSCEMQKGGIKVYVEAKANGFVSATSEVCRFERNLDAVKGVVINGNELVWNTVDKAISYVVVIDGKEYNVGAVNSYSLKSVASGEHTVGVYPVAKGYNSPEATTVAPYNKVQLATPTGVTLVDGKIVWNEVAGATAYTVKIGDKAFTTDKTSIEFKSEYLSGKSSVAISVCAAKAGDSASESEYSDVCTVNYAAIDNVKYENGVVSWSPVATANGYVVTVGNTKVVVKDGTSAKIKLDKSGVNEIKVAYTLSVNGEDREISYKTVQVTAYEVKFYNNDGTYKTVYAAYGDEISAEADEVPGYVFSGWYDVPNGGKNNGTRFVSNTLNKVGNMSLYAYFSTQRYTVTFDAIGGLLDVSSKEVYYSEDYVLPVPVSPDENLVFGGWYADVNGAGTRYTDNAGNSIKAWSLAGDATLKANWLQLFNFTLNQTGDGYLVTGGKALADVTTATIPVSYKSLPVKSVDDLSTGTSLISINIPDSVTIASGDGQGVASSAFKSCKTLAAINIYKSGLYDDFKYVSYDGVIYEVTLDGNNNITAATLSMIPLGKTGEMRVYDKTTIIDSYAFSGSSIEKVVVPASVEKVGKYAFTSCSKLTEVEFENEENAKPLVLESEAFKSCSYLTKVTLPARLAASSYTKTISPSTTTPKALEFEMSFDQTIFTTCNRLAEVNVVGTYANAAYSSVDGIIYDVSGRTIIYCPKGRENPVTTDRATAIASGAFDSCTKIESVEIGATVTTIGAGAFYGCNKINTLTFEGTKDDASLSIKTAAFYSNTSLAAVELPENLYAIEEFAFGGTSALKKVTINSVGVEGKVAFADLAFGTNALYTSYYVQTLVIGEKVPSFGIASVVGNEILLLKVSDANVNFKKGEKDEYYSADGTKLVYAPSYLNGEFVIKEGVKEICANVFTKNTKITAVTIPSSVEKIGEAAFYNCSSLKTVTFVADSEGGADKLTIGKNAFNQCSKIVGTITFPARLTNIGNLAFNNVKSVSNFAFTGTKLEEIGEKAFQNCDGLTEVVLPEGLKTLRANAFAWCDALEKFHISSTVTEIGENQFANDDLLNELTVAASSKSFVVTDGILYKTDANKNAIELIICPVSNAGDAENKVVIPNTVVKVADYAFRLNKGIKQIIFEDNAKDGENAKRDLFIGAEAFYNYKSNCVLEKVVLPEGMSTIYTKAFYSACANEVVVPSTVNTIQKQAFYSCYVEKITFADGGKDKLTIESGVSTKYDDGAFTNCYNLKEIVLPERTESIGDYAFYSGSLSKLTRVVIPSTVTTIGKKAFAYAKSLTDVTITDTEENKSQLTSIAEDAFYYDLALETVDLPDTLTEIGKQAFYSTAITELVIPANVTAIGAKAFYLCSKLEKVTFAKDSQLSVLTENVFDYCNKLVSVGTIKAVAENNVTTDKFVEGALPAGLTQIDQYAFRYANLTKVYIPVGVTSIGAYAFAYNDLEIAEFETRTEDGVQKSDISNIAGNVFEGTGLTAFTIPDTTAETLTIGKQLFKGCYALESLKIPASVKGGLESALDGCVSLKDVVIASDNENYVAEDGVVYNKDKSTIVCLYAAPAVDENGVLTITASNLANNLYQNTRTIKKVVFSKNIVSIGSAAFKGCTNLTEIEFAKDSGSVEEIPTSAFEGCTSLTTITNIPASVKKIGASAFKGCSDLASITWGSGITELGASAFENSGLTTISLPVKLETLNGSVFKGTPAVKNPIAVTLPNTIKTLGASAFSGVKITSITLPEGLVTIGNNAFESSFSTTACVKSIQIPSSVTTMGNNAFKGCSSLTEVKFATDALLTSMGNYVFSGCTALTGITLPASLESLGTFAFSGCSKLAEVKFEKGIKIDAIKSSAFASCKVLKSITIPEGVKTIADKAFEKCAALETVKLPDTLEIIGGEKSSGYTFSECAKLAHIELPDSLTYMGMFTFYKSGLEEIVIPNNVQFLTRTNKLPSVEANKNYQSGYHQVIADSKDEEYTSYQESKITGYMSGQFAYCSNLTKVTLPANLEAIGAYVFYKTPKLTDVTFTGYKNTGNALPNSLKELCGFIFAQSGVDSIKVTSDATLYANVFADSSLADVDLGVCNSMAELPKGTFSYTPQLNTVVMPQNLSIIGESAFEESGIVNVDIPVTVAMINKRAFRKSAIVMINLSNVVSYQASTNDSYVNTTLRGAAANGKNYSAGIFADCKNLTTVILGNKVDTLPKYMFKGCEKLTGINIPEAVTTIGEKCFYDSGLLSVNIPENVTFIGDAALLTSSLLYASEEGGAATTHINIDPKNTTYFMNGNQLMVRGEDGNETSAYFTFASEDGTTITVADGVTRITSHMFQNYPDVKKIILPKSVKVLENGAFDCCFNLETVVMPAVEVIEQWAFNGCIKLNYLELPKTVREIDFQAFRDCSEGAVGGLTIDMSAIDSEKAEIGKGIFFHITHSMTKGHGLKKIILPSNISVIPENMFEYCTFLDTVTYYLTDENGDYVYETDSEGNVVKDANNNPVRKVAGNGAVGVYLPETVTTIRGGAFTECYSLTYAEIPASVVGFGEFSTSATGKTFYKCTKLKEVKFLGNNVTEITDSSFEGCTALTTINIPSSVTTFGKKVFYGCSKLAKVTIPSAITVIPDGCFYSCSAMVLEYNGKLTNVGTGSFYNCKKVTGIDTSEIVEFKSKAFSGTAITKAVINVDLTAGNVFENCTSLTEVTFGANVRELGGSTFSGCSKLATITLPDGLAVINASLLKGTAITSIDIPDSVTEIKGTAFDGCKKLTAITLGSNIRTIAAGAFSGCTGVKEIVIPKTVINFTGTTPFKNWTAQQIIKFELDEWQVGSLYEFRWDDGCNATVQYGVGKTTESGTETGGETGTGTEDQAQQAA